MVRASLESHGAVLLRGFETSLEGFAALARSLCSTSVFNESPNRELLEQGVQIQSVDLGAGKGVFHRIQSSGVSEASANAICAGLKARSQPCIVVKP